MASSTLQGLADLIFSTTLQGRQQYYFIVHIETLKLRESM